MCIGALRLGCPCCGCARRTVPRGIAQGLLVAERDDVVLQHVFGTLCFRCGDAGSERREQCGKAGCRLCAGKLWVGLHAPSIRGPISGLRDKFLSRARCVPVAGSGLLSILNWAMEQVNARQCSDAHPAKLLAAQALCCHSVRPFLLLPQGISRCSEPAEKVSTAGVQRACFRPQERQLVCIVQHALGYADAGGVTSAGAVVQQDRPAAG